MSIKLTWDDLLIQNLPPVEVRTWLAEWTWLVSGDVSPVFMTKFGSWFLRRRDGSIEFLNVLEGTLTTVATSEQEFLAMVNRQDWQEENLLSLMIFHLHEEGKIPGPTECYAFAPHPLLTGKIAQDQVMILGIHVWQSICSQTCR